MYAPAVHAIWVFFYGSFMDLDVLREHGVEPRRSEVASLPGFALRIRPLANLLPSEEETVFGLNVTATHAELERLYDHATNVLGGRYLPEAVLTRSPGGVLRPALTYLAQELEDAEPDPAYLDRIARPARALGFPSWYLERIERFRPGPSAR